MAAPLTFAQYSEVNGTNDFVFTNNGDGTATFTANSAVYLTFFSASVPAYALFQPLPVGPILATLTRTGTATVAATCAAPCTAGSAVSQTLTDSLLIIRRQSDGALLLESSGTGAALSGSIGGSAANLQNSDPPNTLDFTSDFVNFAAANTKGRSVSFSSLTPGLSIGSNGLLNSFSAAASGTFSSDFMTPEPGTTALMVIGFALIAVNPVGRKFGR